LVVGPGVEAVREYPAGSMQDQMTSLLCPPSVPEHRPWVGSAGVPYLPLHHSRRAGSRKGQRFRAMMRWPSGVGWIPSS
jgi:hypothetical protein